MPEMLSSSTLILSSIQEKQQSYIYAVMSMMTSNFEVCGFVKNTKT